MPSRLLHLVRITSYVLIFSTLYIILSHEHFLILPTCNIKTLSSISKLTFICFLRIVEYMLACFIGNFLRSKWKISRVSLKPVSAFNITSWTLQYSQDPTIRNCEFETKTRDLGHLIPYSKTIPPSNRRASIHSRSFTFKNLYPNLHTVRS